jgi:thiol:disulfide interchange protein DsbD
MKRVRLLSLLLIIVAANSVVFAQGSARVIKVKTGESSYRIKRSGTAQVSVVIEIDSGYHINSNRPSDKNLIATALKIERTAGLSASPVIYPKAKLAKFDFSPRPLSVFEGKAILKLTVRASASLTPGSHELKAKLTVQACNKEQCLRPQTVDVNIPFQVE